MCLAFVCMYVFLCIHTCNVSTSARGSWSSAPEAAGINNRVAGIENDDVDVYICVLVLYICMFSCLMHKDLSSATELLVISARGSWIKKVIVML